MRYTYPLPTQFFFLNGPVRWLPSPLVDHHLPPSAATPSAAAGAPAATPAIDLSSEKSKHKAPVIFWRGFPCYTSSPHSGFVNDTHEGERRCNFRSEGVPCMGLLHEFFTGGSVRAEPGQERQMLPASRRRQRVPSVHPQRHQCFDRTFGQGPRSGVEDGSRRGQ